MIVSKKEMYEILDYLKEIIDNPVCELNYNNDFELLCAVMLSAQTTDSHVNKITKILFEKYNDAYSLSKADVNDVIDIIKPLGLSKSKSVNLISIANDIYYKYNNLVPQTREELMTLRGVGRKTSNVILVTCFNIPAIAVDTHVKRVCNRLQIVNNIEDTLKIEQHLQSIIEPCDYGLSHHLLLLFGRRVCTAKNPKCQICKLKKNCNFKR